MGGSPGGRPSVGGSPGGRPSVGGSPTGRLLMGGSPGGRLSVWQGPPGQYMQRRHRGFTMRVDDVAGNVCQALPRRTTPTRCRRSSGCRACITRGSRGGRGGCWSEHAVAAAGAWGPSRRVTEQALDRYSYRSTAYLQGAYSGRTDAGRRRGRVNGVGAGDSTSVRVLVLNTPPYLGARGRGRGRAAAGRGGGHAGEVGAGEKERACVCGHLRSLSTLPRRRRCRPRLIVRPAEGKND